MKDALSGVRTWVTAVAAVLALTAGGTAQQMRNIPDVGMTLDFGPMLPAFVGYDCATFTCQPFHAGGYGPGSQRSFTTFGAPGTPYLIAVGLAGPCTVLPPLGNALLLGAPLATLHVGVIGPHIPGMNCGQGRDIFRFTMPGTVPLGVPLRFQSVGVGAAGILAFGPAIDAIVR